jgi:hypothetical protein
MPDLDKIPSQPPGSSRRGLWLDCLLLTLGLGLGAVFVRLILATGKIYWGLDWDLAGMISLVVAPLGPALLAAPCLLWRKPARTWTAGEWLVPGAILTGLAWLEVFLDGGLYLGALAKLICGPTALLLTPALGLAALIAFPYSLRRPAQYGFYHWLGLALSLLAAAGCVWFVLIMLKLRF